MHGFIIITIIIIINKIIIIFVVIINNCDELYKIMQTILGLAVRRTFDVKVRFVTLFIYVF